VPYGLGHRLGTALHFDVGSHPERVGTARAGVARERERRLLIGQRPELRVAGRRHALHDEFAEARDPRREGDARVFHRRAQLFGRGLGLEPQGVVGPHLKDEVHAAFEVQTEGDLLARRHERPGGQRRHGHHNEQLPAEVLVHS
jgi:hypothetical protein